MALPPTGRRSSGNLPARTDAVGGVSESRAAALAKIREIARPEPAAPAEPAAKAEKAERPRRRFVGPIATAVTESEIANQLRRLARLWASDEIDMDAPRGSYLNFLV
ncbi:MAG: hypothetical protein NXI16_06105 [Alphaproteobacteria bacterium]|nr:hypothetical protein [Alphaproteobacteria bacterium]